MSVIMSERLKELRKEKGLTREEKRLTQEQAAKEMFMSRTTLAKYENPDTDIDSMRVTELMNLAKYYNCDPRYITGDISCKDKEVSDIHDAIGFQENAIGKLMQKMADAFDAFEKGRVLEIPDHLLVADFMSYLVMHIDETVLKQYVEFSVFYEIGKSLIDDKREHGLIEDKDDFSTNETIRNTVVYDYFAQKAKDDLKDSFKMMLEEWLKGRINEDVERKLEEINNR